jgi:hypothetical protein
MGIAWSDSPPLHSRLTMPVRWSNSFGVAQNHGVSSGTSCLKGNPVRTGSGPAAVNGDEIRECHCFGDARREGPESRVIREPEDLPEGER